MTEKAKMIMYKMDMVDAKMKSINEMLEKETSRKIDLISKGRYDLNQIRKEAKENKNKKEILMEQVTIIEAEIQGIKKEIYSMS